MIDLHTHILPGVDDGVQTEDEAVEFARVAWADGTRTVVATPHCREGFFFSDRAAVLSGVRTLQARLEREGVELRVVPGAEVHICPDIPERVRDGRAPTLADNGKCLLFELSLSQYPVSLEELLFSLKLAGLEVLFAHPERVRYFQDDPLRWEEMVRMGALGQITTGSILGQFGGDTRDYSERLVREGQVHVLASDGHNVRGRPPTMSEALGLVAGWVGEERARSMVEDVPRALLEGRRPDIPPLDTPPRRRRSFLGRWFGRS